MNTPTPRTDARQKLKDIIGDEYVAVKFTCQLERELTAALEEVNSINAERESHRGTRKAWIELDDNRQILEKQLKAVTEQRDGLRSGIDYASDQLAKVTEQRDKLAEALRKIKNAGGTYSDPYDELDFIDGVTFEALQSLTEP